MRVLDSFGVASASTSKQNCCDIVETAFGQLIGSRAIHGLAFIDLLDGLNVEFTRREEGRELVRREDWSLAK